MIQYIKDQIKDSANIKLEILENTEILNIIQDICLAVINTYKNNRKVLVAGNGGSAADAQHIAAELVSRFYFDRPGLSSIALTTDTSILTGIGNDYGYDRLFARQVEALGEKGDLFIGISTSGNSSNIIKALQSCKDIGIQTVGFTGGSGGKMESLSDYFVKVPSSDTPRIQESHILIGHIMCAIVEKELFNIDGSVK